MGLLWWMRSDKDLGFSTIDLPIGSRSNSSIAVSDVCKTGPKSDPSQLKSQSARPVVSTFEDIASQFELCHQEVQNLRSQVRSLQARNHRLEVESHQLDLENGKLITSDQNLRTKLDKLEITVQGQKTHIKNMTSRKPKNTKQENEMADLQKQIRLLKLENTAVIAQYSRLQAYTQTLSDKEPQRDTVSTDIARPSMYLAAQPFVVVLVDGDAYAWAPDLFKIPKVGLPGALAATRLKNEVTRYIIENTSISAAAKVVAKVFINAGTSNRVKPRISFQKHQLGLLETFRVQFTETLPLFDFIDVGHGKERSDEKIRENFHLLLSNPCCHLIFLATCTDNGFARMLEQYRYHTAAYEKIVVITPGFVVREIAALGFREVCWPSVFAERHPQQSLKERQQRTLQVSFITKRKIEDLVHNEKLGLVGATDETTADLVVDMVPVKWDSKRMSSTSVGGLGLRMSERVRSSENSDHEVKVDIVEGGLEVDGSID